MELSICQFPLVIPSPNTIENACSPLCNVVRFFNIARFAEVDIELQQIVGIRLLALDCYPVVPQPVEGCTSVTIRIVFLGGLCRSSFLVFYSECDPPVDEPLRRGTVSALQAGEERCGDQLIQEVVNW